MQMLKSQSEEDAVSLDCLTHDKLQFLAKAAENYIRCLRTGVGQNGNQGGSEWGSASGLGWVRIGDLPQDVVWLFFFSSFNHFSHFSFLCRMNMIFVSFDSAPFGLTTVTNQR